MNVYCREDDKKEVFILSSGPYLQGEAEISFGVLSSFEQLLRPVLDIRKNPREAHVHPLDHVGERQELVPLLGALLDVVAGAGVVTQSNHPGKPIKTVSHRDIYRLTKYPVSGEKTIVKTES